jgi:hypothetical protein
MQAIDNTTERVQLNGVTEDTVILKKVDGNWKVVYSNLTLPSQSGNGPQMNVNIG